MMRKKLAGLILGCCLLLPAGRVLAVITDDGYDSLILGAPGDTLVASGVIYRSVSIVVQPGAGIYLPQSQTSDPSQWSLQLVAPFIYIGGTLCAEGVSFATTSAGVVGSNSNSGTGGSGFGGVGGYGQNNPGTGGPVYDVAYLDTPGSMGSNNPYGGGGSIRIDAEALTLAATALINARASQYYSHFSGGGGSGGCVCLNSIQTDLLGGSNEYHLVADGGPGQLEGYYYINLGLFHLSGTSSGGGGGGGGRIKIYEYPYSSNQLFHNSGDTKSLSVAGGVGGGGSPTPAASGQNGAANFIQGYTMKIPTLQSPADGAEVGTQPTLLFSASDVKNSQFVKYEVEVDTITAFNSSAKKTFNQLTPDTGWGGQPYYKSNQMASYSIQPSANLLGITYYWRVRATNSNGIGIGGLNGTYGWSSWSSVRSFTVNSGDTSLPDKPALLFPAGALINVSKTPALQVWGAKPDPLGDTLTFSIVLSQDPNLSNPKIIQPTYPGWDAAGYFALPAGITATCQIQNTPENPDALVPGATYYWQVTVYDSFMMSNVSLKKHFTVIPAPPAPALLGPVNAGTITTSFPRLQMTCASPTTINLTYQYKLEIGADNFQTITTYLSQNGNGWDGSQYTSGQTASLQIPTAYGLVPGQKYSWRVTAYDVNNNNWSPTSAPWTFTVVTPPNLPQLLSPDNNFTAADATFPFQFQDASPAGNTLTFRYQLSADNFQSTLLSYDQGSTQGVWNAPSTPPGSVAVFSLPASVALQRGTPYQWRVAAFDGFSWSPFSETRTFSLAASLSLTVSKIYPSPAVSRQNLHVLLQPTVDADATLHLFNAQAKEIRQVSWHLLGGRQNDYLLDISACASGAYFTITEITSPYGKQKWVSRFAVVN